MMNTQISTQTRFHENKQKKTHRIQEKGYRRMGSSRWSKKCVAKIYHKHRKRGKGKMQINLTLINESITCHIIEFTKNFERQED